MRQGAEAGRGLERADEPETLDRAAVAIADEFARLGAAGVLAVDTSALAGIERRYGAAPHREVISRLAAFVRDSRAAARRRRPAVPRRARARGARRLPVRPARLALLPTRPFRPRRSSGRARLRRRTPWCIRTRGDPLELPVGVSVVLHNPTLRPERQIVARDATARSPRRSSRCATTRRPGASASSGSSSPGRSPSTSRSSTLDTKTVFGYEALARGPEGSDFHTPMSLFHAAESEGLIFELDCLCRRSGIDGAEGLPAEDASCS